MYITGFFLKTFFFEERGLSLMKDDFLWRKSAFFEERRLLGVCSYQKMGYVIIIWTSFCRSRQNLTWSKTL